MATLVELTAGRAPSARCVQCGVAVYGIPRPDAEQAPWCDGCYRAYSCITHKVLHCVECHRLAENLARTAEQRACLDGRQHAYRYRDGALACSTCGRTV